MHTRVYMKYINCVIVIKGYSQLLENDLFIEKLDFQRK